MRFNSTSIRAQSNRGLVLALALASSLGCQQRITSTAKPKPKPAPAIQVKLPDLDTATVTTPPEMIRLPALKPFQMTVTLHNVDAKMRLEGVVILLFQPLKGSADAEQNWNYGSAFLTPKDASASTWECTGVCEGVAKPVPMRAVATLGATIPIAEFKVQGVADFKSEEEKPRSP